MEFSMDIRAERHYRGLSPDNPDPDRIESAMISAQERVDEWSYEQDAHGYCHDRTDWIGLLLEIERLRATVPPENGWQALIRQQLKELIAKDQLIKRLEEVTAEQQLQIEQLRLLVADSSSTNHDPDWYIAQQGADKAFHQTGES